MTEDRLKEEVANLSAEMLSELASVDIRQHSVYFA
jgi:hypothetical protein